jgi:hypothetical protein
VKTQGWQEQNAEVENGRRKESISRTIGKGKAIPVTGHGGP